MTNVASFPTGGFRYIEGVFQYSAGVAAEPGFVIERVRFPDPLRLTDGFAAARQHLESLGRPLTAFCACELRSPAPFTEAGFDAFNREYVGTIESWGLYRDGINPIARTNVCPLVDVPQDVVMYAFAYTVPERTVPSSFIIAGGGEAREGGSSYRESVVRLGDVSIDGMRAKMRFVVQEMESRLRALGFGWQDAVSTQVYTVHDIGALVREELVEIGAARGGIEWHFARPPVENLEFEMDVRGAAREIMLPR